MAAISIAREWHEGEQQMHRQLNVPEHDNPTSYMLTPQAAYMLQRAPLLAVGTLDSESRPWTSLWGGESGFSRPLGGSIVGIRAEVDPEFDPVVEALVPRNRRQEEMVRYDGEGKMVAGLTIDLMTRQRVKLAGRMVAGAVAGDDGDGKGIAEMQAAFKIEQSLGNCPKYLNKKDIRPAPANPHLVSDSPKIPPEGLALINKADLFFISSSHGNIDMDTNHRGGPPGFIRVISNEDDGAEIIYPEYSGNRLYQTLGNLKVTPMAGIVIPDFDTGDVLYATGHTEILAGPEAAAILPRSNLAVKIKFTEARFIRQGLPFRGIPDELSPYNPNVRVLATEGNIAAQISKSSNSAKLLKRTEITPTISRYRFSITNPVPYKPGQWVAMDFSEELDIGYSHMRDDDPRSLNDDYVRTFTVSSPPIGTYSNVQDEFEITIRTAGPVTTFLSRRNQRSELEVPLRSFGGDFVIETAQAGDVVPFVAGGVGITPVLGQLATLDLEKFRLFWILRLEDINLALDVLKSHNGLGRRTTVFFTGSSTHQTKTEQKNMGELRELGAALEVRRPEKQDFETIDAEKWYLCAGLQLRERLLDWLKGKTVLYESFNY